MSELSDRQRAAIELLEAAAQVAHDIVHKPAGEVVDTESGPAPTFQALSGMILDLVGGLLLPRREAIASAGAALALDVAYTAGVSFFDVTLDQPHCALTFLNTAVPAGYTWSFTVRLVQGTGANQVTFPADIQWSGNRPPLLAYDAGAADWVSFTWDGTHWVGLHEGSWFNVSSPA